MSRVRRSYSEWKARASSVALDRLAQQTGLSRLTLQVCVQRGFEGPEAIQAFLTPRLDQLTPASRIQDLERAAERLAQAREAHERIRVFGDYDVDGTTATALLLWVFRDFGWPEAEVDAVQPDRFRDGYGLGVSAVEQAAQDGIQVLVTVDCGITSFEAAARARDLGIDLIVVDHHSIDPERGLPPAYAIVNPKRRDCLSGLTQLCGCGLAFYLAIGLRQVGRMRQWFNPAPNLKQHLDLVVLATAADRVPLTGDNHVLVKVGLEVLKASQKPGVKALLEAAGLGLKELSPGHLGFVLGPRINASGRLQSASLALELLTTQDPAQAAILAQTLEGLNRERSDIQNQIWDDLRLRVEQEMTQGKHAAAVVVADPGWHEGVVGIVASRVTEAFQKPAVVLAIRDAEGFAKGSVRSYGDCDVLEALRECSSHLLGFGGHRFAAGLSVATSQWEAFAEAFNQAVAQATRPEELRKASALWVEGECQVSDLTVQTVEELERLGPFGPGNPEPVFVIRADVGDYRILKERHLKLTLQSPMDVQEPEIPFPSQGRARVREGAVDAIWFHAAERPEVLEQVTAQEASYWAGVPELNRFRGRVTPTFRVRDWRESWSQSHPSPKEPGVESLGEGDPS